MIKNRRFEGSCFGSVHICSIFQKCFSKSCEYTYFETNDSCEGEVKAKKNTSAETSSEY